MLPHQAFANIQKLRTRYRGLDGPYGFVDAVAMANHTYTANGTSYTVRRGQIAHRYLVLDQSMIMAALDNALKNRAMQRHFAADRVLASAKPYLALEHFSR